MVIIQEETTGCGIASVANIVGCTYAEVKSKANSMGIFADDESLYSDTAYVRNLLNKYGVNASKTEVPFKSWEALPDIALLATKFHLENGHPFSHWVVFKRELDKAFVLDSAAYLEQNERTDFQAMEPKWFIEITKP